MCSESLGLQLQCFVNLGRNFPDDASEQWEDTDKQTVIRHCRWEIVSADISLLPRLQVVLLYFWQNQRYSLRVIKCLN
jgi:hypothetical protein